MAIGDHYHQGSSPARPAFCDTSYVQGPYGVPIMLCVRCLERLHPRCSNDDAAACQCACTTSSNPSGPVAVVQAQQRGPQRKHLSALVQHLLLAPSLISQLRGAACSRHTLSAMNASTSHGQTQGYEPTPRHCARPTCTRAIGRYALPVTRYPIARAALQLVPNPPAPHDVVSYPLPPLQRS